MRQGPHSKRGRGRGGNRRSGTPNRNHTFDSNGPDVRIRGNAHQVHEKYLNLARDASTGGDRVLAESYYQHAEHYYRILSAFIEEANQDSHRNRGNGASQGYNGNGGTPVQQPHEVESAAAERTETAAEPPAAIHDSRSEQPAVGEAITEARPSEAEPEASATPEPRRSRNVDEDGGKPTLSLRRRGNGRSTESRSSSSDDVASGVTVTVVGAPEPDAAAEAPAPRPRRRRSPPKDPETRRSDGDLAAPADD